METRESKSLSSRVVMVLIYVFLILVALLYLLPILWVFMVSFKTNAEIFTNPFALPESFNLDNYEFAWTKGKLGIAIIPTVVVYCAFSNQIVDGLTAGAVKG